MLFGIAVLPAGARGNTLTRALDLLFELFGVRVLQFEPILHDTTPSSPSLLEAPAVRFRR